MNTADGAALIREYLGKHISTWFDFAPQSTPFVVYDADQFVFFNHPNPPQARGQAMIAATATEINDILTATIPAEMVDTPQALIPLMYHECFHVYQQCFDPDPGFDFFRILASYPELDPTFRAVCALETETLNSAAPHLRAQLMAGLARRKREILTDDLLLYERSIERKEGTAAFVEQKARLTLFGIAPPPVEYRCGWSRQYSAGAAICWLLDELLTETWKKRVELGEAPTDILIAEFEAAEPDTAHFEALIARETTHVAALRAGYRQRLQAMEAPAALRIRLPEGAGRAFDPSTMVALGDGSVLHTTFLRFYLPAGKLELTGDVIEDHTLGEVRFPAPAFTFSEGVLESTTERAAISLAHVRQLDEYTFAVDAV